MKTVISLAVFILTISSVCHAESWKITSADGSETITQNLYTYDGHSDSYGHSLDLIVGNEYSMIINNPKTNKKEARYG